MTIMKKQDKKISIFVKKLLRKKPASLSDFSTIKQKLCAELKIPLPNTADILETYRWLKKEKKTRKDFFLENSLKKRPVRSLSGVAVVAVLTKPWPCPGQCLYCPLEKGIPKSYLSGEPAVERAKTFKYDPFLQMKKRLEMLKKGGHPVDKIELIVIGGTWSYLPLKYQVWFIKRCFDAANGLKTKNLEQAQKINEKARHRIIGLTLETRPDYITPEEIKRMRKLGCTRVELGVQIIDDQILKKNKRGHGIEEIVAATRLLKNAGFKICYHLMPGLYGSCVEKDFEKIKEIFTKQEFQPDMIKIYPCMVTKGSKLYHLWKKRKYEPYSDNQLINLLTKIKSIVPSYVRINRLIRDIPAWQIKAGSTTSNLREIIKKKMRRPCRCIRCREIRQGEINVKNLKLVVKEYSSSGGKEIFLSLEDKKRDKIAAFLRLRLSKEKEVFPFLENAALIRELHTYGQLVELNKKNGKAVQHLGLGKRLVATAEQIAEKYGYKKMAIISGVGVREYYRRLGYRLKDTYMFKILEHENSR